MTALSVHVLAAGRPAEAVAEALADAGYTVSGPVDIDVGRIKAVASTVPGADAVVVVGDFGIRSAVPTSFEDALDAVLPGFGERVRREDDTPLTRVGAGLVGSVLVFGVETAGQVAHIVHALGEVPVTPTEAGPPGIGLNLTENREPTQEVESTDEEAPSVRGWMAAVRALGAEIHVGRREELPEPIEKFAPVVNVLHTAGEQGMMKLPSGRRYSIWGWPDLRRDTSKVLAISWGDPLAEVVALHRHPDQAGTCIDADNGLLPAATADLREVCERVVGRAPPSDEGALFALSKDAVWIVRGRRVIKWDGSRERDDGNIKQVLASLSLHWSNR